MHNLDWLVAELMSWGWMVVVETQGTLAPAWLLGCSVVTLSPKPPSSYDESYRRGVAEELLPIALFANGKSATREREDHAAFAHTLAQLRTADDGPEICVKIVVFDTLDYKFASGVIKKVRGMQWSGRCTFFLQPGTIQGCDDIEEERALVLGRTRQVWDQLCADKDPWMEEVRILPQIHTLVYGSAARGV
jgi:7-carboxy-7-deazaguanine synthase